MFRCHDDVYEDESRSYPATTDNPEGVRACLPVSGTQRSTESKLSLQRYGDERHFVFKQNIYEVPQLNYAACNGRPEPPLLGG